MRSGASRFLLCYMLVSYSSILGYLLQLLFID